MSRLLIRPKGTSGRVSHVTPENAGWTYVGFDLHRLAPGEAVSGETGSREACLVFVTGKGRTSAGGNDLGVPIAVGAALAFAWAAASGARADSKRPARSSNPERKRWSRVTRSLSCERTFCASGARFRSGSSALRTLLTAASSEPYVINCEPPLAKHAVAPSAVPTLEKCRAMRLPTDSFMYDGRHPVLSIVARSPS